MAEHTKAIDISNMPDLLQLAEEIHHAGEPWVLRRGDEDLVVMLPLHRDKPRRRGRATTQEDSARLSALN